MINYDPIDCGHHWPGDWADLRSIDWVEGEFLWEVGGETPLYVRVIFAGDIIVRILDEMALSTEVSLDECRGLSPHHFAYEVQGDSFFSTQSETWRLVNPGARHFRFLTGSACVDVISSNPPVFQIT